MTQACKQIFFLIIVFFMLKIVSTGQTVYKREMRGVWIATVKNIDYPSDKLLSVENQKKEFIDMIDYFEAIGINAVMFQVRPAADAFYASKYEPWSEWLTGKQGKAPDPYYDPLKFMIEECHKRGMEFHAWINPFRAVATIEYADIADDHISKTKPEWIFTYDIHKYFDPGIPEVRKYVIKIIRDIVKRYDIDGVHFDDYFYPYPVRDSQNRIVKIPDNETFKMYNPDSLSIEDWRRDNMNTFIKGVNEAIKKEKPQLPFGVAPSGVWRNKTDDPMGSDTRGLAHYDYLYSDVLKWLQNDWIDYVVPQLYWPIGNKYADYEKLVKWWSEHTYGKNLYIGQAVYQSGKDATSSSWREPDQLIKQLQINRKNPMVSGSIFYKAKSMTANPFGFCDSLKNNYYAIKVQTPKMPWLNATDSSLIADLKISEIKAEETHDHFGSESFVINTTKLGKKIMLSWDIQSTKTIGYRLYRFRKKEDIEIDEAHLYQETKDNYFIIDKKKSNSGRMKFSLIITQVNKNGTEKIVGDPILIKMIK